MLAELTALGATIQLVGEDRLRVEASKGALTPEIRTTLAEQKPALLALLRNPPKRPPFAPAMRRVSKLLHARSCHVLLLVPLHAGPPSGWREATRHVRHFRGNRRHPFIGFGLLQGYTFTTTHYGATSQEVAPTAGPNLNAERVYVQGTLFDSYRGAHFN